jgi:DnaJ-related protein SCJ1
VSEAYEALSDPQSRATYDKYGHEGLKQSQQGGGGRQQHGDPFDLFSRFFGGNGHFNQGNQRGASIEVKLGVSLRDFYTGRETDFMWEKQHICEDCGGTGAADRKVHQCPHCNGAGRVVQRRQLAPGMFTTVQMACEHCGGRGKHVKKPCAVCAGQRVVRKQTKVNIEIEKGAPRGMKIILENEADEHPDYIAGDLHVTLDEKKPDLETENPDHVDGVFFRRKGHDLYWHEVLSVREAWMGDWTRNITHLDGHVVKLGRPRGKVVQPGHVDTIVGEGMPVWQQGGVNQDGKRKTRYGKLYVEYSVVLPDKMTTEMEDDFRATFDKWRRKVGTNLRGKRIGGDGPQGHDEL